MLVVLGKRPAQKGRRSDFGAISKPLDLEKLVMDPAQEPPTNEFSSQADAPQPGLLAEFVDFVRHNKKWWLIPILVTLGLVGLLVLLSSSAVAPFIYPLF
jgi:hypothetical protein